MSTALVIAKNVSNANPTTGHAFAYVAGHAIGQQQTGNQASPGGVGA
ncbi:MULTISPECIES: hypothetical protein [unclassified Variovorax]|nr:MULTISPECIES: hypothetical protein [unclassified Variovorax]